MERCKILIAECQIRLHGLRCDGRKKMEFSEGEKTTAMHKTESEHPSYGNVNLVLIRFTFAGTSKSVGPQIVLFRE